MTTPEEQRFDFGVTDDASTTPEQAARSTKETKARRTSPVSPKQLMSSIPQEVDEVTKALKERIVRLQRHAHMADATEAGSEIRETQDLSAQATVDEACEPSEDALPSLSIAEFYARIKSAIATQFAEEVWVAGEIRSLRVSNGHHFFELADQGADGRVTQQLEVACWSHQWRSVQASLDAAGVELEVGRVIRVLGKVSVWEAAGKLRFNLSQLDVEALLGSIAAARRQLLATLAAEGLLVANKRRIVPLVPLRIGLVTSQGSEAQKDFLGQLARSGFSFEVELAHSLVQGVDAPGQIVQALARLKTFSPDLCVIVRGGGSRNDLAAFDAEIVARAIATSPYPIWVGIGHTGDRSVADEVANMAFATPTACGEAVAAHVGIYWDAIGERVMRIGRLSRTRLLTAEEQLHRIGQQLARSAKQQLVHHEMSRVDRRARVQSAAAHHIRAQRSAQRQRSVDLRRAVGALTERCGREIAQRTEVLHAFDPARQLGRGWAIVRSVDGATVRSIDQLAVGARIVAHLVDGEAGVLVEALRAAPSPDRGETDRRHRVGDEGTMT